MRDYAKVSPAFWMSGSGKALRGCPEAQVIGLYLVTCPSANMIGLYYIPISLMVHETGLSQEGASMGLMRVIEDKFAFYDHDSEVVFVPNAAAYQVGERLTGKDKRKEGVLRELSQFRKHPFAKMFFEKYAEPFGLREPEWITSNGVAPSMPHRCQDQDQEQEQEHAHAGAAGVPVVRLDHGLARNASGDGSFGMAVDAWCAGVRRITGGVIPRPRGNALAQLNDSIREGSAQTGEDPIVWAERVAEAFAREGGVINMFRFVEFISGTKNKTPSPSRLEGPVEVAADAVVGDAAEANFERLRAILANAGRLPESAE